MTIRKLVNANAPTLARLAPACVLLSGVSDLDRDRCFSNINRLIAFAFETTIMNMKRKF